MTNKNKRTAIFWATGLFLILFLNLMAAFAGIGGITTGIVIGVIALSISTHVSKGVVFVGEEIL